MTDNASTDVEADDLYRALAADRPREAVSVILKLRGETCDIDCLYCYEKRKLTPGGRRLGPADAARIGEVFTGRPVAVELHGGEPLTAGRDHIAAVLDALAAQPNVVRVSLQTNGVRLDNDWLDLFDNHYPGLQIGISLDGDPFGNSWRIGYDGHPTYQRTAAALHLLAARGRTAGIITVVTPRVLGRADEVLDHLAGFQAVNAISFVPCFDIDITTPTASTSRRPPTSRRLQKESLPGGGRPAWATSAGEYADFVLAVTARWIASGAFRRIKLDPAVSVIRRLRGLHTTNCHFTGLKCDHVFTLYPDRRLGSCDELPWPAAQLTTLDHHQDETTVAAAQRRSPLLDRGRALMNKCTRCSYAGACGGGCVATRLRHVAVAGTDDAYCAHRMRLVDGVAALLAAPHHAAGAFCTQVRWRPRVPNTMRDIAAFLTRWDDPHAMREPAQLWRSPHGNINTIGGPGIVAADDLDPHHPQWRAGIEDRVWPLVDVLTRIWTCVTYDSCQGHRYPGINEHPTALRVGILPRGPAEAAGIADRLCRAVTAARPLLPAACQVTIGRAELTCENTRRTHPVLDLAVDPAPDTDWDGYFEALPAAVEVLTTALTNTAAADPRGCACPASAPPEREDRRQPA